jgi:copper chaperone CopZ
VRDALESLPWAKHVQVDVENQQATLRADPAQYDEAAIVAVLDKAGFAGSKVVTP